MALALLETFGCLLDFLPKTCSLPFYNLDFYGTLWGTSLILSSRKILAILAWVYLERSWLLLGLRYLDGFLPQVAHERRDLLSCGVGTKAHWMEMWRLLDSGVWLGVWRPLAWSWEKMWHLGEDLDHY